jgi:DNA-binding CsgD family transcriptional regulator
MTPSPSSGDIHEGWLSAGKRPTAGDGPLATAGDDAAFALALAALTKRQRQIVQLRARGLTIAEICDRYYLSENTVKNHLRGAFRTLGLGDLRHQARLGRACYLLGRYDVVRDGETARRRDGKDERSRAVEQSRRRRPDGMDDHQPIANGH